jgi:hypothetical protein
MESLEIQSVFQHISESLRLHPEGSKIRYPRRFNCVSHGPQCTLILYTLRSVLYLSIQSRSPHTRVRVRAVASHVHLLAFKGIHEVGFHLQQ